MDKRACDRYDIVSRVFHLKVKILKELLVKKELFGPVQCYLYTIEWQKRGMIFIYIHHHKYINKCINVMVTLGLPHVHLLLWLKTSIRPDTIDSIISAELPDPNEDPQLYEIVSKHMIHGPCGLYNTKAPCMEGNQCLKR